MAERRRTLVVFAKAPQIGQAKTRLARAIGAARAVSLYRGWTARLLREARDPRWRLVLAVTPDLERWARFAAWGGPVTRIGQGRGDLGARMARAMARCGPGPVVIVGSDIPDLKRSDIAAAFAALKAADAVFGPARDGGYWLIGLKSAARARALRKPIRWSSAQALADTSEAIGPALKTSFLRVLIDIDTAEDYEAWVSAGALRAAE
jgi:uncharacterized protein